MPLYPTFNLTNRNDTYTVTMPFVDVRGLKGDDTITVFSWASAVRVFGGEGNDTLNGGSFSDTLYGDSGNDILTESGVEGQSGDDFLYGGSGDDVIMAGSGNDTIYAGLGRDIVYGGRGADNIDGGLWSDQLYGGLGNDQLYGRQGNDRLYGNDGNDELWGGEGNDRLVGGGGNDFYGYIVGTDGADHIEDGGGEADYLVLFQITPAPVPEDVVIGQSANGRHLLVGSVGDPAGQIVILNQFATGQIETIGLLDGAQVSAAEINTLLANMTAYIATQATPVDLSDLAQIRADATLMSLITATFTA